MNEHVHEDMPHCKACIPMTDEDKRAWDELRGEGKK